MAFQFSLIRFVPDPARGEFVNIGAIAGDDESGDWELRSIQNHRRAKALDPRGTWPAALSFLGDLDERIAAIDELVPDVEPLTLGGLRLAAAEMRNIVQITAPAPVVADSAESALDLVFEHLVFDSTRSQFRFAKKHRALGAISAAFRQHDVPREAIEQRARVRSGDFAGGFDFAVRNGAVIELVQAWSFQLPNQHDLAEQVKAWSWVVHELRDSGGTLAAGESELTIERDVEIFAVAIPPLPEVDAPAYAEARAAFAENGVTELVPDEADEVGRRAAELLGAVA